MQPAPYNRRILAGSLARQNTSQPHQPRLDGRPAPFRWTLAGIAKDQTGKSYAWLTPVDGVAVKVTGRNAEKVLAVVKAIEALEVTR